MKVDRESLLVEVAGDDTLRALEDYLGGHDLTLGVDPIDDTPVGAWLTKGAPGARDAFVDPADHLIAGITMTLSNGKERPVNPGTDEEAYQQNRNGQTIITEGAH